MAERSYPVTKVPFHTPDLADVASVLQKGLKDTFQNVDVTVVDCPDLTQKPFQLADKGLCGDPCLVDIGGNPYLLPVPQKDKAYDLDHVATLVDHPGSLMVGAGAAPCHVIGTNGEMITNMKSSSTKQPAVSKSCTCTVNKDGSHSVKSLSEPQCSLMMNLFVASGNAGKVLRVKASRRVGDDNFMLALRTSLAKHYGSQPVGLGGVFVIEKGMAWMHVMPDFADKPLTSREQVYNEWLKFYDVKSPITCLGYVISHDPGFDLRMDHFHCFSDHGEGGHYHYDTTPEDISYLAYFNVPRCLYRIDQPAK